MISYSLVGDAAHAINLINIAVYGTLLYHYGSADAGMFDEEWLTEGFCLPYKSGPFRTTHDISGYVMVAIALLGIAAQRYWSKNTYNKMAQADRLVFWAMIGALGHACGHFIIANAKRHEFYPPADERFIDDLRKSSVWEAIGKAGPGYPLFWMPLVKTYMMNTAKDRVAIVALILQSVGLWVPVKFGFAYTQAVLFAGQSIDQLMLPSKEKGFEYMVWPILTILPNGIFAWIECLTCTSSVLMRKHGHVVYDLYMASSYLAFYLVCSVRTNKSTKSKIV